ncbi:hypothetical protein K503DRAFT_866904, partial [Rhizopogon vinicolor AM-OR11-026]
MDLIRKISPFIAQPISQLNKLHKLTVWDLGDQAIEHLMQMKTLQTLSLDLNASPVWGRRSHLQFPGFDDSKLLRLISNKLEYISDFLDSLQVVRTKGIDIRLTRPSENGSAILSHFFAILKERCDNDNLSSFIFVDPLSKFPVKLDVFMSLHAYHNLSALTIWTDYGISISNQELCQLARAWPKLKMLNISRFASTNQTTLPTFHGLINLIRLCPSLTYLALVIDTTKLNGIDLQCPGGGICNMNLRKLILGNSHIDSPLNVALMLSALFPNLGLIIWIRP